MSDEWTADINVVASTMKLWFRELPEPLLTHGLYHAFIEAARGWNLLLLISPHTSGYDNERLRHIRLHEQVNELPDPNYATLKFFMGHLDRCAPPGRGRLTSQDSKARQHQPDVGLQPQHRLWPDPARCTSR